MGLLQIGSVIVPTLKNRINAVTRFLLALASARDRNEPRLIPPKLKLLLRPWKEPSCWNRMVPLQKPLISVTMHTDDSLTSWRANRAEGSVRRWTPPFTKFHINILDMATVMLRLRALYCRFAYTTDMYIF